MSAADRARLVRLGLAAALCFPALAGCTSRDRRPEQDVDVGEPPATAPSQEAAQDEPEPQAEPSGQAEKEVPLGEQADHVQEDVTRRIRTAAAWLDSFLADERSLAEENQTWARLRFDVGLEEGEGVGFDLRPKIRVALPSAKRRAQLTFSGETDSDTTLNSDVVEEVHEEFEDPDEKNRTIGANYFLKETTRNNVRLGAGLKSNLAAYGDVRLRHLAPLGSWDLRGTERLRYYTDNGFESIATVDLERRLSPVLFVRATTRGSWFETDPGYYYSQSLALYQLAGPTRVMTYEVLGSFVTRPNNVLDLALVRFRYRERLWRDWIFFEIAPQIALPRDRDYDVVPGILFRLDLIFAPKGRQGLHM